ncbi:ankyrin repeat protein [Stylonychia lemnae]|uniref:Ankyrin repeat protein n=1 Tax=Stylonychia lemnae TaxID=5949 RepID=A0A078ASY6_STYLE|nr:ankyrin repeat protein [Stylonychia lemnae]|eukprot:CDW85580.1 ankyrin repeat protein [Stylonychia lemnae]
MDDVDEPEMTNRTQKLPQTTDDDIQEEEADTQVKRQKSIEIVENYQLQFVKQNMKKLNLNEIGLHSQALAAQNVKQFDVIQEQQNQIHDAHQIFQRKKSKKVIEEEESDEESKSSDEDDINERDDVNDEGEKIVNYKQRILDGSFLPSMLLLQKKIIKADDVIDPNQGLKLLHFACYFGKIKPIKSLVEIYKTDINTIDYRGQTPLHVATVSGELAPVLYICSQSESIKDAKDNALMTPLMNTVSSNHEASFVYLHFKENCDLKNVDLNGQTLLHLAARQNSINIARLLKHIYQDQIKEDSNLDMNPGGDKSPISTRSNQSSVLDNTLYFDINRTNNQGQTPIFLTVHTRSYDMLKFLMQNRCNITLKDQRGDSIKDYIYRYMLKEQQLLDTYLKYENRLLIESIFSNEISIKENIESLINNFRCSLIMIFHMTLLILFINILVVYKSGSGFIEKKNLNRDRDSNLVGQLLFLMEQHQFHKIDELSKRQKHSRFFARCIGEDNCRAYYTFLLLNLFLICLYMMMLTNSFIPSCESISFLLQCIESLYRVYEYSKILFLHTIIILQIQAQMAEDFLFLTVAISRQMTLMELNNVWNYKHCFQVKTQMDDDSGKNYFMHKSYSLFKLTKNLVLFMFGKNIFGNGKSRSGAKKIKNDLGQSYVDLHTTQRSDRF